MKINKIIALSAVMLLSVGTYAQDADDKADDNVDRVMEIATSDNETTSILVNDVDEVTFEEVVPLSMNINVETVGSTSLVVDFPMPEGCSHWLMLVTPNKLTGTDKEIRHAIMQQYQDNFTESKYLKIDSLSRGTTYYIYAQLYDKDGVAAGLSMTQATTDAELPTVPID